MINDDRVAAGQGFGEHPHRSMEIFSYVIEGELEHQDSMGNGRRIKAGEFQYLSAGNGVTHSEFNPSSEDPVHFLQIWLQPNNPGGEPRYEDYDLLAHAKGKALTLIASPDGAEESMEIRADGSIYFGHLEEGERLQPRIGASKFWLHLISGSLEMEDEDLAAGDGVAIEGALPEMKGQSESSFFLFALS